MLKRSVLGILAAGVCAVVAGAASGMTPQPVSPSGLVELRCPMFSWSAVSGAAGYELLVYEVLPAGEVGKAPLLSVRLPGGAAAWTPPGASCLAAGGRYAWTLRVLGKEAAGGWAESVLFEVAAAPSLGEVEATLARLRRHLGAAAGTETARPAEAVAERLREAAESRAGGEGPRSVTAAAAPSLGTPSLTVDSNVALGPASDLFKDGAVFLWDDTVGNTALGRLALASATGDATNNTAFGREALRDTVAGAVVEDGSDSDNTAVGGLALWYNTTGYRNTASGYRALSRNTTGSHNTASGFGALNANTSGSFNTASGDGALNANTSGDSNTASGDGALRANNTGDGNTASGYHALRSNTTGSGNTASGRYALRSNSTGLNNTAIGSFALSSNTTVSNMIGSENTAIGIVALSSNQTGHRNTAVGRRAGQSAADGDDNIFLGSGAMGSSTDDHTIRIGGVTGTGEGQQDRTFIAGIWDTTTANANAVPVKVDSAGQLGITSSSREVKQDLREVGDLSRRLFDLRPVAFRYKVHAAGDPQTPLQFGLIAEEVAEVFPELVVRDRDGRPQTVKYHLLRPLMLNELQRAEREREQHRAELRAVRDRLTALEQGRPPERSAAPWWRRLGGGSDEP